jgi:flagellar biosynthetic protein FlhB
MELLKSVLKLVIVGMAVRGALAAAWGDVLSLAQRSPMAILHVVREHAHTLMMNAALAYLALAAADYGWQLWQFEKQLRMSREDVKQEMKQSEGDPLLKARMRSAGRALARKLMLADVPKADVVITNPTHIAVAIKYDPEKAPAPYVLAIGQRKVAERIKAAAKEAGVPMVENRPLARALLASAQVGTMIPPDLYVAVAEVLAFVMRQRGRRMPAGVR